MTVSKLNKLTKYTKVGKRVVSLPSGVSGSPITATPGNGYTYYTFISPGTASFTSGGLSFDNWDTQIIAGASGGGGGSISYNFLIVGGGGGAQNGGGGAGGIVVSTAPFPAPGPLSITVGNGGSSGVPSPGPYTPGTPGGDSSIGSIVAKGGGQGGQGPGSSGGSGGGNDAQGWSSVGGGTASQPIQNPGISNILQYGTPGGSGSFYTGGGGGGASSKGQDSQASGFTNGTNQPSYGGNGQPFPLYQGPLIGIPSLNPFGGYFGGGGGGGSGRDGWVNNAGATPKPDYNPGGGGKAADHNGSNQLGNSVAGVDYLGGGGGGYSWYGGPAPSEKPGGKGIVVIRI